MSNKKLQNPSDSFLFGDDLYSNQVDTKQHINPDLSFNATVLHTAPSRNNKISRTNGIEPPTMSFLDKEKDIMNSSSSTSNYLKLENKEFFSAEWANWVVVLGLDPKLNKLLLTKLTEYGSISEFVQGEGNYILIKFESPLYAEAASYQGYLLLSNNTIVGIKRMTLALSKSLGVSLVNQKISFHNEQNINKSENSQLNDTYLSDKDFNSIRHRFPSSSSSSSTPFTLNYISRDPAPSSTDDDEDIFLRPYKKKSICDKLLECFWSF